MGHALRGGGAEVELSAVGGGVCSARWLGHGTLPWWRRREGRRRSEGYPGAGVGARGTLGRREGASRGGGVSGEPHPALGAGAADRVRYGCKVDRSREEFGSDEILASHEDHVGSGNEGRAEHLELAERGGPGGPRRARRREGRLRSEGYPGAGVGARGTLGRREGASRGGGVSGAPRPALGAGAADRVRYGCKVDRSREEFGFGEILASHEDHVGSGNEGRAEHLELAERGGPGGPRRASGTGRAWRTGWSPRCAGDRCAAVEAPDERGRPP